MLQYTGGMLKSLLLLFVHLLAGEGIARLLRIPVPGSVLGMMLLTASLRLGLVAPADLESGSAVLLDNLSLLFVPPGVGLLLYFKLLQEQWPALLLALLPSTFAVLAFVGLVQQALEQR